MAEVEEVDPEQFKSNMFDAGPVFKALANMVRDTLKPYGFGVGMVWVNEIGDESWRLYFFDPKTNLEYVPNLTENWLMNAGVDPYDVMKEVARDVLESFERGEDEYGTDPLKNSGEKIDMAEYLANVKKLIEPPKGHRN